MANSLKAKIPRRIDPAMAEACKAEVLKAWYERVMADVHPEL